MAAPAKSTPRDAQVMAAILKDMGVLEYEPRVINQMLEFAYRYVTDILDDAKIYSSHANKKQIDPDDVKLAVQCRMDHSFTTPPPRDLLMEIARHKNSQALPLIKPYTGPRIPPDRYCLSAPNYRLKTVKKSRIQIGLPHRISGSSFQQSVKTGPTVNISSNNPTLTVVTKGVNIPTVTFVSKPSSASTPSLPKPTFRISSGTTSGQSLSQQLSSIGSITSTPGSSIPATPSVNSILGSHSGLSGSIGSQGISPLQNVFSSSLGSSTPLQSINSSQGVHPSLQNITSSSSLGMNQLLQNVISTSQSIIHTSADTSVLSANPLKRKLEDDDYDVM